MHRTERWLVAAIAIAAAAAGCRDGGEPPETGGAEDFQSFAVSYAEAVCGLRERCCDMTEPVSSCESSTAGLLVAFVGPYVEDGSVAYHEGCGTALLGWVRDASCDDVRGNPADPATIPAEVAASCEQGVVSGTRELGASCGSGAVSTDMVCAPGLVCDSSGDSAVCAEPVPAGEACGYDTVDCASGLYCGPDDTCVPRLGEGEACDGFGDPCADGLDCDSEAGECVVEGLCDE